MGIIDYYFTPVEIVVGSIAKAKYYIKSSISLSIIPRIPCVPVRVIGNPSHLIIADVI